MATFYTYFKENMEGLGLPAPETLFGNIQAAVSTAVVILSQIDKFGKAVTVREIIGAGTKLEGLTVIAGLSAAFYVGAVIGSIAVALGRTLSGGTTMLDVLTTATQYNLHRPWLIAELQRKPGLYQPDTPFRDQYRFQTAYA